MSDQKRIFLSSPHMSGSEQKYIQEAFDLNWIAPLGNNVDAFEKELAQYNDVTGSSVLSSGTAAIHLALRLLNIGDNDKVFCSTMTFVATANPILYQGATPVFIDSEEETWNMCPKALRRAFEDAASLNDLPKAVIVVHLYGQSARIDEIIQLCDNYGVPVIEDAAESLGSEYKGQKSGTHGTYGIYSFNGNKIITSSGGGALIAHDEESLQKARFLATQARDPAIHYQHSEVGYNYRMSNIVAGVGRGQLEVLDKRVNQRRNVFSTYQQAFEGIEGIVFQKELENTKSNRWLTALTIDPQKTGVDRTTIIEKLSEKNIEARPAWKPMHLQPLFEGSSYYTAVDGKSVSDKLFEQGICLPSGSNMIIEEQQRVIYYIKNLL